jgi:hypothetical protein
LNEFYQFKKINALIRKDQVALELPVGAASSRERISSRLEAAPTNHTP